MAFSTLARRVAAKRLEGRRRGPEPVGGEWEKEAGFGALGSLQRMVSRFTILHNLSSVAEIRVAQKEC